jgi:hypothetical protein
MTNSERLNGNYASIFFLESILLWVMQNGVCGLHSLMLCHRNALKHRYHLCPVSSSRRVVPFIHHSTRKKALIYSHAAQLLVCWTWDAHDA